MKERECKLEEIFRQISKLQSQQNLYCLLFHPKELQRIVNDEATAF